MERSFLVAIDGTGSRQWRRGPENSHVLRFHRGYTGGKLSNEDWTHGPGTLAFDVPAIRDRAITEARNAYARGVRVFDMAGHSRGGHICLLVARALTDKSFQGASVRFLALFDAVDRSFTRRTSRIPANVRTCRHALRDRMNLNRTWFGNTGRAPGEHTDYREEVFWASHGAIGGDPADAWGLGGVSGPNTLLTPPLIDRHQSPRVWRWMLGEAVRAGVPIAPNA